jgi:hypothetical protein
MKLRDENVNDYTPQTWTHLKKLRNEAGTHLSNNEFDKAFECILDIKRDVKRRKLAPGTFDNLLNEVLAIGVEMSTDDMLTVNFYNYMMKYINRLQSV